jgi:hypothetical protein
MDNLDVLTNKRPRNSVPNLSQTMLSLLDANGFNQRLIFNVKHMEDKLSKFGISMDNFGDNQPESEVEKGSELSYQNEDTDSSFENSSDTPSKSKKPPQSK